jgi:hypothetical protein
MGRIFISYRRDDTEYISGYIYEYLAKTFGKERIFFDVDTIAGGVDYRKAIADAISDTAIMLVVLGPRWLAAEATPGVRRLDQPNDPVRLEIEAALRSNIPIFPLLVQQASIPAEQELPGSIAQLTYQNAFAVRPGTDFPRDMDRVSATIERYVPRLAQASAPLSTPLPPPGSVAPIPPGPYPGYPAPTPLAHPGMQGTARPAQGGSTPLLIGGIVALLLVCAIAGTLYLVHAAGGSTGANTPGGSSPTTGTSTSTQQNQDVPPPPLVAQPETYNVSCQFDAYGNYYDPAPSSVVTLNNSGNSVALAWSTSITDNDPAGKVWASTRPASGTVAPGGQAQFSVVPGPTFCHDLQSTHLGTFHIQVTYHIAGHSIPASTSVTVLAN